MYEGVEYNSWSTEVDIGKGVDYRCFNGMKHITDFDFSHQTAGCGDNNTWTPPAQWEQCTDSRMELTLT